MTFSFERMADSGLIVVAVTLDGKGKLRMILDTANGIVESEIFEITTIDSLGITHAKLKIQVYDFLSHGIFSNYDGLLGLDFLEGKKFCIDTHLNKITIQHV